MSINPAWFTWVLPRAIATTITLRWLGVDTWLAFATAGVMLEAYRNHCTQVCSLFKDEGHA